MQVEIISIGDELLIGQTTNTNAAWMGEQALRSGLQCSRVHTIGDDPAVLRSVLDEVLERVDLVWITGGLGPTQDDRTKDALVGYFGCDVALHAPTLAGIEAYFAQRKLPMLEVNRQQALLPTGPRTAILSNPRGTAAGMWFETTRGQVVVAMPGVPSEMQGLMLEEVLPRVRARWPLPHRPQRTVRVHGVGEAYISNRLGEWETALSARGVAIAFLPHLGSVRVRFSTVASDPSAGEALLDQVCSEFVGQIGSPAYSTSDEPLAQVVGAQLLARNERLAVVESCTGGALAAALTAVPGASRYFLGGIVAYDGGIKSLLADVDPAWLEAHGAVSESVALAMAQGGRRRMGADWVVATTGVAGPDPAPGPAGGPPVPVGTVVIAVAGPGKHAARAFTLGAPARHTRAQRIERWVGDALDRLRQEISAQ